MSFSFDRNLVNFAHFEIRYGIALFKLKLPQFFHFLLVNFQYFE